MTGLLTVHCPLKRHLLVHKLGLVNSPECDRSKQASEMDLCDCEAEAALTFRHLGQHFMKPGDLEENSVSKILHLIQGAGLFNA